MASKGALQTYNNELVRCIEDLREKREEVNRTILRDEEEKAKIQKELTRLTERLSKINEDLARRMQARNEFDQTIQETEAAYMKARRSNPFPRHSHHPPSSYPLVLLGKPLSRPSSDPGVKPNPPYGA
jgi:Sjoegren syndrome nuclear autoantigen 1